MEEFYGYLKIILGPMFSNKSTILRKEITMYADIGLQCLLINYSNDNRYELGETYGDNNISSHNSSEGNMSTKVTCIKVLTLSNIDVSKYHCIGIDECQFYPDLYTAVTQWVKISHKIVICASLKSDASMNKFGQITDLIHISDKVKDKSAKCVHCMKEKQGVINVLHVPASFTAKIVPNNLQEEIGGKDKYIPLCRRHYEMRMA